MADKTKIAWCEATWNPIRGCSRVSDGCMNCYAEKTAYRFSGLDKDGKPGPYATVINRDRKKWNGNIMFVDHMLDWPMRRKGPRMIFVNSMSDLFHENVKDEWIDKIFAVMALSPQHIFQILTKRPERMREYLLEKWQGTPAQKICGIDVPAGGETGRMSQIEDECEPILDKFNLADPEKNDLFTEDGKCKAMQWGWPLPNVWLGVSVEDQKTANVRIPILLDTPAAIRWISAEPLLDQINISPFLSKSGIIHEDELSEQFDYNIYDRPYSPGMVNGEPGHDPWMPSLDWVVVGGESGPGARMFDIEWPHRLLSQCNQTDTAIFVKQLGANPNGVNLKDKKGADMGEWPPHLRIQNYPQPKGKENE